MEDNAQERERYHELTHASSVIRCTSFFTLLQCRINSHQDAEMLKTARWLSRACSRALKGI